MQTPLQKLIKQNEVIQSLYMAFASASDNTEIQQVLDDKLNQLFDLHSHYTEIISNDGLSVSTLVNARFDWEITTKNILDDAVLLIAQNSREPFILDLDVEVANVNCPPYIKAMHDAGIRRLIVVPLFVRDKRIGFWRITQLEDHDIADNLHLLTHIGTMLSMALDGIKTREEIKHREEEKSKILAFSNAIASAKDKVLLGKIIGQHLLELFNIHEYTIWIISRDEKWVWAFIFDPDTVISKHPEFKNLIEIPLDNNGDIYRTAKNATDVLLLTVEEYLQLPGIKDTKYVQMAKDVKVKGWGCHTIRLADEDVAVLTFNHDNVFEMRPKLGLFKSICSQLAIAASNMMSREEIGLWEVEKRMLLSLSNEIASLRSRSDLFKVVNAKIKEAFSIDQFGIMKINEDGQTYSAFMMDLDLPEDYLEDFERLNNFQYSTQDVVFHQVMNARDTVTIDVNEIKSQPQTPEYIQFWSNVGFVNLAGLALKTGGEVIGAIFLNIGTKSFNDSQTYLLKGVCAQLSLAVSNILANEKNQLLKIKAPSEVDKLLAETDDGSQILKTFKANLDKHFRELADGTTEIQLRVSDFAMMQNLHENYLNAVVKSKTGKTVKAWISEKMIAEAQRLLLYTTMSNKEISYRLGFIESSHFSNYFKKYTGNTPLTYRNSRIDL